MLETRETAHDPGISKSAESDHATSESIKTSPPNPVHDNLLHLSVSRQSHCPVLKAQTNNQPPGARPEPDISSSRSPSTIILSSADSKLPELRSGAKRKLTDFELHEQESKSVKQEENQQDVIELEETQQETHD
ncbi:hypothetical protein QM012_009036 [Aureobasidium pullulans]|uniref:Uncharacterized protein n=1 Tax=Aureobasidium pullulans TaxID=5580 RepID=A0ABR0TIA6_AURPU